MGRIEELVQPMEEKVVWVGIFHSYLPNSRHHKIGQSIQT